MKYTAEQLKPKKYPDEKPRMGYSIWVRSKVKNRWMRGWYTDQNRLSWASLADWFIDIPGAPPELEPLAYPQNKPEQDGEYWVHNKVHDKWDVHFWSGNYFTNLVSAYWDNLFDYFIPIRLDKENEMVFRENIWDTDEMKAEYDKSKPQMVALFDTSYGKPLNTIVVLADELTAFARHWLDLQGYDVVKRGEAINSDKYDYKFALERIRTWTCNDGRGYEDPVALLENIDDYINKVLDVVKREPEIKACPFCGGGCYTWNPAENDWSVACYDCTYNSGCSDSESEAIRLHNLISAKRKYYE